MREIALEQYPVVAEEWLKRDACDDDTGTVYCEPGIYTLKGRPVIIYGRLAEKYDRMIWAVRTFGYQAEARTSNISRFSGGITRDSRKRRLGESRIFGYRPRVSFNPSANFCAACSSAHSHPSQHAIICEFGRLLNALYETAVPDVAARHSELLRTISADWIIPGTRFTSGIVNHDNPLKYHLDKGNLHDVMSCMVVFRNMCEGGMISIPEFGARWALDDHSYFLFDGQSHIHGVTPLRKLNKRSYRYSVVYYSLRAMGKCGTMEEELSRARREKRERERRRV